MNSAFCPAHVTGFFEIHDHHQDPLRRGSRGAGFSLDLGAISVVDIVAAEKPSIEVFLNDEAAPAPVTRAAVRAIVGRGPRKVTVRTRLDLPVSQGWGMSAAGSLSAAIAAAKGVGLSRSDAVVAAHVAEVQAKTGLGDVAGAIHGGVEFRREPGLPPFGAVDRVVADARFVIVSIGSGLLTKEVLSDPQARERIARSGAVALAAFKERPTLPNLFRVSRTFARSCGFTPPEIEAALTTVEAEGGLALQPMLGTSVVAYGDVDAMRDALSAFGEPIECGIDESGARLLKQSGAQNATETRPPPP